MIVHRDIMANGSDPRPHSSILQVNTLLNHRLKLPPITTSYNRRDDSRSSHGDSFDLSSCSQELTLPPVKFGLGNSESVTETDMGSPAELEAHSFSFSRVYTVLPPIGEKRVPSTPLMKRATGNNIPNAPTSVRKNKRSTRRSRVKKQLDKKVENVSKSNTVVDNVDVIKTCNSEKANESFSIEIADSVSPTVEVNHAQSQNITDEQSLSTPKLVSDKPNSEKLKPDTIYTTIIASVTTRDASSDNELWPESPFPQFSTVPDDLRLYADVYPPSPPPNDKRARNVVEKTRELLVEENGFRVSFMENIGYQRRNATCAELDNALKNAVQQLRDVFLRKTMEELCMVW